MHRFFLLHSLVLLDFQTYKEQMRVEMYLHLWSLPADSECSSVAF